MPMCCNCDAPINSTKIIDLMLKCGDFLCEACRVDIPILDGKCPLCNQQLTHVNDTHECAIEYIRQHLIIIEEYQIKCTLIADRIKYLNKFPICTCIERAKQLQAHYDQ